MDDYQDAAQRHLHDASILHHQSPKRVANASQLYGFSAECALKVIARQLNPGWRSPRGVNGHIPKLFTELTNIAGVGGNAKLSSDINLIKAKFSGWDVNQRYHNQGVFVNTDIASQAEGAAKNL